MITSSPTRTTALLMALWSAPLVWGGVAAAMAADAGAAPFAGRTAWWGLVVLGVLLLVGQAAVRLAGERERLTTATALRLAWPVPDPLPRHPDDIGD